MYCDHCGKPLGTGAQFCTSCGIRILPGAGPAASSFQTMSVACNDRVRRHIGTLSILWAINGALRLLETFAMSVIGPMVVPQFFGVHAWRAWDFPFHWAAWPFSVGFAWVAALFGAFGVVHLILAWALREHKSWARPLGLAVGFLALLRFPLGTALGIYTIWVLLPESSAREYDQIAVA